MTVPAELAAPTVVEVDRIRALTNRAIRNLQITDAYARLSSAFRSRTGPRANWCTFATWASRQAGRTIRGEDLSARLRDRLGRKGGWLRPIETFKRFLLRKGLFEPRTRLGRAVAAIHTPFDAFERASEAVARGNVKVFEEIGREFARYLATVPPSVGVESPEFAAFLRGLRDGPPPDGQECLRRAFTRYQLQPHEPDDAARAALVLLANLEIGFHEQTRLQPEIAEAVDAPVVTAADLGRRTLHALLPASRAWPAVARRPARGLLGLFAARVRATGIQVTREVVTEALMVLSLPGQVLALGEDLRAASPPAAAATHPELAAFVAEHDPCGPGEDRCGASDWCDLHQRMHYIVHLFRAYAENETLFSAPFSPEQIRRFKTGVIPDGEL
jgi:hypothetical protein